MDATDKTTVDGQSLAAFRLAFGLLLAWHAARNLLSGRIESAWIEPSFHFRYWALEWVPQPNAFGLYVLHAVLLVAAGGLALGRYARACALICALCFGWVYSLEAARYLNHHYLVLLIILLFAVLRSERRIPARTLFVFRAQVLIVYAFAAIAKIDGDWLAGRPLSAWLAERADLPLIGPLLAVAATGVVFAWAGFLIDGLAAPLVMWRRTRLVAFAIVVSFHLLNAVLFRIGVFPWMSIAMTTLLFPADWPTRYLAWTPPFAPGPGARTQAEPRLARALVVTWLAFQVAMPLRHWLYASDVAWSEEGHRYSWRMLLRSKRGSIRFVAYAAGGRELREIDPSQELRDWQVRKMLGRPDMILQYARHLADRIEREIGHRPEIRAITRVSLNGRRPVALIDEEVDLAAQAWSLSPARWITPSPRRTAEGF